MTGTEILVTAGGVALIAALAWFFFGPKQARRAEFRGGVQEVEITVKGGYSPNLIRVREGVPLRLVFDRQENSDCSSRVVFPDFGVSKSLAAFGRTPVEFTPDAVRRVRVRMWDEHAARHPPRRGRRRRGRGREQEPCRTRRSPVPGCCVTTHGHEVARAVGVGPTREVNGTIGSSSRFGVVVWPAHLRDEHRVPASTGCPASTASQANYGAERVTVDFDPVADRDR